MLDTQAEARKATEAEKGTATKDARAKGVPLKERSSQGKAHFQMRSLLKPHARILIVALFAAIGESAAGLLEPWPLKIVLDNVLKSKDLHGWLNRFITGVAGTDQLSILRFAALAVIVIAIFEAVCSYVEKRITTGTGEWVAHDLRSTLYSHIQRLSLSFHDQKRTGDLISRVTSDIDSIQGFIASGLLGVFINTLTLAGMVGVMLLSELAFHADRAIGRAGSVRCGLHVYAPHQESRPGGPKERGRNRIRDGGSPFLHPCRESVRARGL